MLPRLFSLALLILLPAGAVSALPFVVPWVEHGYGLGLAFHVLAMILATGNLSWWGRERARTRDQEMHGIQVTAVIAEVEPLPADAGMAWFAGHTVILEFTDPDGKKRRKRDTSGLGGYALAPGTHVIGRLMPGDPENLEVLEIVGPQGRYPVTNPAVRATPWAPVAALTLAVCFASAVVLGPLYGLPASAAGFMPSALLWLGLIYLLWAVWTCLSLRGLHGRATGEVTQVWERPKGKSGRMSYAFIVRFTTQDGRRVHRHHAGEDTKPRSPGARVEVRYDPDHPPRFQVRTVNGERNHMWQLFLWSALLLGGGTAMAALDF